jgi:hypothetical protein
MAHVLSQLDTIMILSNVDLLSVRLIPEPIGPQDDGLDRAEWLELLRLFPAVETMFVYRAMTGYIASALDEIAEGVVTEVLPALHLLFLENDGDGRDGSENDHDDASDNDDEYDSYYQYYEKPLGSTERFLSLRKLSGHPVTIVKSEDELVERYMADESC